MKQDWLDYLQESDLRGDYAELAAVIGLELTVLVAEKLGGEPLLTPRIEINTVDDLRSGYLDLYPLIGLELTIRVAEMIAPKNTDRSGGQLYLPMADHLLLAAKIRYIQANDKVSNRRQLRRDTGLSLRHVYRICEGKTAERKSKRDVDPRQLSLLDNYG